MIQCTRIIFTAIGIIGFLCSSTIGLWLSDGRTIVSNHAPVCLREARQYFRRGSRYIQYQPNCHVSLPHNIPKMLAQGFPAYARKSHAGVRSPYQQHTRNFYAYILSARPATIAILVILQDCMKSVCIASITLTFNVTQVSSDSHWAINIA